MTGYWANAQQLDVQAILVAAGCLALTLAQRTLSNQARVLRRTAQAATGRIEFQDGHVEPITIPYLLAVPETTLRLLGLSVPLLALGWLVSRL